MFEPVSLTAVAEAFKATLDLALGQSERRTSVEILDASPTQTDLSVRW